MRWMIGIWVVVLLLAGGYLLYRAILTNKTQAKIDAIRKAGYPVTLEELDKWYPAVPDDQNAAHAYRKAFAHIRRRSAESIEILPLVGTAEMPARDAPLPEEMKKAMLEHLATNEDALQLLHEATKFEQCRYLVDLRGGCEVRLEHLAKLQYGSRLLALDAMRHAGDGKPEPAVQSLLATMAVARSLANEPVVISQLTRTACVLWCLSGAEWVINRAKLTDDHLSALATAFADAEDLGRARRALAGERCMYIDFFRQSSRQQVHMFSSGSKRDIFLFSLYKFAGLLDMDYCVYLDVMGDYLTAADGPLSSRITAAQAVETRVNALPRYRLYAHMLLPALAGVIKEDVKRIARFRAAIAALALERYRLASSGRPDKLDALVPTYLKSVPTDPFDGKPIRYKRTEKGYVVYSIGENLIDDDGAEKGPKGRPYEAPDITFTVED